MSQSLDLLNNKPNLRRVGIGNQVPNLSPPLNWNPHKLLMKCEMVQLLWKTVWQLLKKLNIALPYDPFDITPKKISKRIENKDSNRYMYTSVHSSIFHNSPRVETTYASINR